jgi:beta-galactosidase
VRISGEPTLEFTARRWTSQDLDLATHTPDLVPRDRIFVNLDAEHYGLGSAACGPGPAPADVPLAHPVEFGLRLRTVAENRSEPHGQAGIG